jgi:putative tryptophan/tyrosine transport system substrate-binding protein
MQRREFITLFGGATAAWPFSLRAQQSGLPVIGFLSSRSPGESAPLVSAFHLGLGEAGYVAGKNVAIEYRWADGHYDRLPVLASELVELRVAALLAAGGQPPALAAKAATSTIPIVFSGAGDPVAVGLVASFNRPGGNLTGMGTLNSLVVAKGVELLKELVPTAKSIAFLSNPKNPSDARTWEEALAAATKHEIRLEMISASTEEEIDTAFDKLVQLRVDGLIVAGEPFFDSRRMKIIDLVARCRVPTSYFSRENVVAGGLISYGTSIADSYRQAGNYVGRILKGEKPSDLPVMQPTKFELIINLKTAKTLGLMVPPTLIARADEVVE